MPRLLIDLSTLLRWHGPPVGIARCQQKYADHAARHLPHVAFTVFDPRSLCYRSIPREAALDILAGRLKADMTMMPDLNRHRRHFVDRVPRPLRPMFWWTTRLRRKLLTLLEDRRLGTRSPASAARIERVQAGLISRKNRHLYYAADGSRIRVPSFDLLAGPPVSLGPEDTTLAMQTDWIHTDIAAIAEMKRQSGFRHVILCHDIIPIQFPQWYSPSDVAGFQTYYDQAFRIADRVMFTSRCTARDAGDYCSSRSIRIRDSAVVPMGADIAAASASAAALPQGLAPDSFALFVSTVEPRKNHRLLVEAWQSLVRDGIVEPSGFKLVFVGRRGWMMGTFFEEIARNPSLAGSLIHLENVDDALLTRLYLEAGFCLYPPKFEGFGLPIVEALSYGKALLVADAGPMPEIAGDFAIALDPDDPSAWADAMRSWIERPSERRAWAKRAAEEYRPLTWEASAARFFEAATAPWKD